MGRNIKLQKNSPSKLLQGVPVKELKRHCARLGLDPASLKTKGPRNDRRVGLQRVLAKNAGHSNAVARGTAPAHLEQSLLGLPAGELCRCDPCRFHCIDPFQTLFVLKVWTACNFIKSFHTPSAELWADDIQTCAHSANAAPGRRQPAAHEGRLELRCLIGNPTATDGHLVHEVWPAGTKLSAPTVEDIESTPALPKPVFGCPYDTDMTLTLPRHGFNQQARAAGALHVALVWVKHARLEPDVVKQRLREQIIDRGVADNSGGDYVATFLARFFRTPGRQQVSLACPAAIYTHVKTCVRTVNCEHIRCFDLDRHLDNMMRESARDAPSKFYCPICKKPAPPVLLQTCRFMQEVTEQHATEGTVFIDKNGTVSRRRAGRRRAELVVLE